MLDLPVRTLALAVLKLLVDVIELESELVDVAGTARHLATRCVESVNDLVYRISAVHFEQILVDGGHRIRF